LLTYQEDESSNGIGCAAPGASNPDPDTITGMFSHNEFENSSSGQNQAQGSASHEVQIEWVNSSIIATTVTGMSEGEIIDQLESNGMGMGDYSIDITVDVTSGGAALCTHSDDGEEVNYEIVVWVLDYTIEAVTE
jgi:hypothetical protein